MISKGLSNFLAFSCIAFLAFLYWPEPEGKIRPIRQAIPKPNLIKLAQSMDASHLLKINTNKTLAGFGAKLFFDREFSSNHQVSCASCHKPELSFTDGLTVAQGVATTKRNTPTLINVHLNQWQFWDGRAHSLVTQAWGPIEDPREHGINRGRVGQILFRKYKKDYKTLFGSFPKELGDFLSKSNAHAMPTVSIGTVPSEIASYALGTMSNFPEQTSIMQEAADRELSPNIWFGKKFLSKQPQPQGWLDTYEGLSPELQSDLDQLFFNFGLALEAFQQTIVSNQSPFDSFLIKLNDSTSILESYNKDFGPEEWQGFKVFAESGCSNCHLGANFSDQQFHNIGLPYNGTLDLGRAAGLAQLVVDPVTCDSIEPFDREACKELKYLDMTSIETLAAFKTPTLRNLKTTAPYMHDGRFSDLDEVLNHYESKDVEPALGHRSESIPQLEWTEKDRAHLKAFLNSLNSTVSFLK